MSTSRRNFITAAAGAVFLPKTLLALQADSTFAGLDTSNKDIKKILADLPHARPHLDRIAAACDKWADIYRLPLILPAKVQAIESGYNPDAISGSYAVGGAQLMHYTARDMGATLPPESEFAQQEEVLSLRRRYSSKLGDAVAAFQQGDDTRARALRTEGESLKKQHDDLHKTTMADFKKRMFDLSPEERRAYDPRFDPAAADDMLVHYLAILARSIKRSFDLEEEREILLLAGVAYNAGVGRVKRKPGIPVVAESVEYANKLMLFQTLKL